MNTPLHFTLTDAQRKILETWLDAQSVSRPLDEFTVTFNVTPTGIRVKAYPGCLDTYLEQGTGVGLKGDACALPIEEREVNQVPVISVGNLQVWVERPPVTAEILDERKIDALDASVNPFLYFTLRDDPRQTRMPVALAAVDPSFHKTSCSLPASYDESSHPLSLHSLWRLHKEDGQFWQDRFALADCLRWHGYALRDYVSGRLPTFESLHSRLDAVRRIPNGQDIPLSAADWQQLEDLNQRLMEAERFAREQELIYDAQSVQFEDDPDWGINFDFELICWLREDDPDWSEDRDSIVYCNSSIITMDNCPLEENWNTFSGLAHDPLGGRPCCYFMHDLVDHFYLEARDLRRIGDLSVHTHPVLMKEVRLSQETTGEREVNDAT